MRRGRGLVVSLFILSALPGPSGVAFGQGGRPTALPVDTADHSPHRQRFITVTGFRLHVLDWDGHGPVVLLLPGWGSNAHVYDDLAPQLTGRFHVLAVTIRGFVPSEAPERDAPSGPYSVDRVVEDIRGVLASIGADVRRSIAEIRGPGRLYALARLESATACVTVGRAG
jgi:hypothetical protein